MRLGLQQILYQFLVPPFFRRTEDTFLLERVDQQRRQGFQQVARTFRIQFVRQAVST